MSECVVYENHSQDTRYKELEEVSETVSAKYGTGGNNQPLVVPKVFDSSRRHNCEEFKDVSETVQAAYGTGGNNVPMVMESYQDVTGPLMASGYNKLGTEEAMNGMYVCPSSWDGSQISPTLTANNANGGQRMPDKDNFNGVIQDVAGTLDASYYKGCGERSGVEREVVQAPMVRRLTPTECQRLQGFPDGWMDIGEWVDSKGKVHKDADAPKYKAAGNSIALPFWQWLANRIRPYLGDNPTMASLFDGIGGFPLTFARAGIEPVWASEIEEFPMAVTKRHFGENRDLEKYIKR